jgi:dihydrofolate synthase / folylpolyglutamate synthase
MFGLSKYGNGIGLHRIVKFCEYANIALDSFADSSIVITGSNGKGSTAKFVHSLLRRKFDKVGCFTSPHLFDLAERFVIDDVTISHREFDKYKGVALDFNDSVCKPGDYIGQFELLFLVGLQWFIHSKVRCSVWEAGIGGRYDPTRALQASVSALTSLDLEHTELLGSTKELIAYDKLDVNRCGGDTVISPSIPSHLSDRLRAYGEISGKTLHFISEYCGIHSTRIDEKLQKFTLSVLGRDNLEIALTLLGQHQVANAVTALEATRIFLEKKGRSLENNEICDGLEEVVWPGRMEQISECPNIWIDVGHTPEAIGVVVREFVSLFHTEDVVVVYGVSHNKSIAEITHIIEDNFRKVILSKAYKNGADVNVVKTQFVNKGAIIGEFSHIEDAVAFARKVALDSNKVVLVLGGLFFAIEFLTVFRGGNPKALEFF